MAFSEPGVTSRVLHTAGGFTHLYTPYPNAEFTTRLKKTVPAASLKSNVFNGVFSHWTVTGRRYGMAAESLFLTCWPNAEVIGAPVEHVDEADAGDSWDDPSPFSDDAAREAYWRRVMDGAGISSDRVRFHEMTNEYSGQRGQGYSDVFERTARHWDELNKEAADRREQLSKEEAERRRAFEQQRARRQQEAEEVARKAREDAEARARARDDYWKRSRQQQQTVPPIRNKVPPVGTCWTVFHLLETAPQWMVVAAYKAAMKYHHPDSSTGDKTGEQAKRINAAYAEIKRKKGWS